MKKNKSYHKKVGVDSYEITNLKKSKKNKTNSIVQEEEENQLERVENYKLVIEYHPRNQQ